MLICREFLLMLCSKNTVTVFSLLYQYICVSPVQFNSIQRNCFDKRSEKKGSTTVRKSLQINFFQLRLRLRFRLLSSGTSKRSVNCILFFYSVFFMSNVTSHKQVSTFGVHNAYRQQKEQEQRRKKRSKKEKL